MDGGFAIAAHGEVLLTNNWSGWESRGLSASSSLLPTILGHLEALAALARAAQAARMEAEEAPKLYVSAEFAGVTMVTVQPVVDGEPVGQPHQLSLDFVPPPERPVWVLQSVELGGDSGRLVCAPFSLPARLQAVVDQPRGVLRLDIGGRRLWWPQNMVEIDPPPDRTEGGDAQVVCFPKRLGGPRLERFQLAVPIEAGRRRPLVLGPLRHRKESRDTVGFRNASDYVRVMIDGVDHCWVPERPSAALRRAAVRVLSTRRFVYLVDATPTGDANAPAIATALRERGFAVVLMNPEVLVASDRETAILEDLDRRPVDLILVSGYLPRANDILEIVGAVDGSWDVAVWVEPDTCFDEPRFANGPAVPREEEVRLQAGWIENEPILDVIREYEVTAPTDEARLADARPVLEDVVTVGVYGSGAAAAAISHEMTDRGWDIVRLGPDMPEERVAALRKSIELIVHTEPAPGEGWLGLRAKARWVEPGVTGVGPKILQHQIGVGSILDLLAREEIRPRFQNSEHDAAKMLSSYRRLGLATFDSSGDDWIEEAEEELADRGWDVYVVRNDSTALSPAKLAVFVTLPANATVTELARRISDFPAAWTQPGASVPDLARIARAESHYHEFQTVEGHDLLHIVRKYDLRPHHRAD